jgi:hypothetical protein
MLPRSLLVLTTTLCIAAATQAQSQAGPGSTAAPGSSPAAATPSTASASPADKKVWTNEDVSDLRTNSTISTVGSTDTKAAAKGSPAAKPKNSKQYQAQLARLEGQIPPLDQGIAELQDAIDGKPTGDAKSSKRPRNVQADDWNVQMQDLQKKKQDILDQIAALKDEARHQGIPPNTLP